MKLLRLEWKRMWRDPGMRFSLAFLMVCVALSVFYGVAQTERQNKVIESIGRLVRQSDEAYFEARFTDEEDVGRVYYYLSQPTSHAPLPEASLSLGQRDLHSYHQSVRLRSLYANLFDGGFENPGRLASGHFDLAFVLVFLLPLLIIATTYDLFSREKSERTLVMIRASRLPLGQIILGRLLLRCLVMGAVVSLSILAAFLYAQAPLGQLLPWLMVANGYALFWFGICGCVIGFGWSTPKSAGVLLGLWTALTVVGPAVLTLSLTRSATQNGAALSIKARQVLNDGWDREKSMTLDMAMEKDPRYQNAPVLGEKFTWSWYFAMHDAADLSVADQADQYFEGLKNRENQVLSASIFFPGVRAQLLFEGLAGTDLGSHLNYYEHVEAVRERMRVAHLPRVFSEEKIAKADLLRLHDLLPVQNFVPERRSVAPFLATFWGLSSLSFVFGIATILSLEERQRGQESC